MDTPHSPLQFHSPGVDAVRAQTVRREDKEGAAGTGAHSGERGRRLAASATEIRTRRERTTIRRSVEDSTNGHCLGLGDTLAGNGSIQTLPHLENELPDDDFLKSHED